MRAWIARILFMAGMLPALGFSQSWLDSLLTPEEAFRMSAYLAAPDRVVVHVQVAEGYALYRSRLEIVGTMGFDVSRVDIPRGHIEVDPELGEIEKLSGEFEIILVGRQVAAAPTVVVKSQGCSMEGVCLLPSKHALRFE
jgi:thiol:disulfide interchange protein